MGVGTWEMGSRVPIPNPQSPIPQKNPIPIRKNVIFVHLNGQQSIIWLCSSTDRIKDSGSLDLGSIPSRVAFKFIVNNLQLTIVDFYQRPLILNFQL